MAFHGVPNLEVQVRDFELGGGAISTGFDHVLRILVYKTHALTLDAAEG